MSALMAAQDDSWSHVGFSAKVALAFSGTFIALGLFAIGPALPVLQDHFSQVPNADLLVQFVGGIVPPVFALASPFAGRLVTRLGVRTVYLASLALFLLAGLGPMICSSLIQILPFRVLMGLGVAGAFTAGMSGIARLPESQRHNLYGLAAFIGGGISIVAFPMVGALAAQSWQLGFLACLLLLPIGFFALALPRHKGTRQASEKAVPRVAPRLGGVPPSLLLLAALVGWTMVGSTLYAPFLLASVGIIDPSAVGNMLAITSTFSLVGSGSYGLVQKLAGTRGVVLVSPVLCAAGGVIVFLASSSFLAMVGLSLISVGLSLFGSAAYAAAVETVGPEGDSGAATGMMSFAIYLPQALFPMLATAIGTRFGPASVYLMLAVLLTAGFALVASRRHARPAVAMGAA